MDVTTRRRLAAGLAWAGAVGAALLAIAHTGATVPLLSRLGPQGGAVPPAVVVFGVGAAAFAAVAVGVGRGRSWGRWLGLGVAAMGVLSGVGQFRGAASAAGIVLALGLGLLLLRPISGREVSGAGTRRGGASGAPGSGTAARR